MSTPILSRRLTTQDIRSRKANEPVVMLTAYDALMASLLDEYCDVLLVGDSLGMVRLGMETTLPVSLEMMALHGKAVMAGSHRALVVVDMPFASYQESPQQAFRNAAEILKRTGAQAVKLEGGEEMAETIHFLTERGIAVMAHIGLTPQHVQQMGGFRVQGKNEDSRQRILRDAKAIGQSGAFSVVVEGVVESLAREITQACPIPTLGIGASNACDGQVLVTEDMLGLTPVAPKFAKRYADLATQIRQAAAQYREEVQGRIFPSAEHCYQMNASQAGISTKPRKEPSA